ncbi:RNA polymerase sigma factor [Actinokineospora sp. PR83]|uniref:RNA polymerase sigma factor n=1 Tax=Actinokineospora sp. PR83 TaxID=2884908 RepID=UPI001F43C63E|nr:RNA polymerase sigma factor [Actinokineospora sp. PR83]MCG8917548.1 RNA polymerase sigma factor [Actinokineospora sp. PR83]
MDERALLRRAAAGDRAAFEEFYTRTSPWLAVRLRKRCADEQLVAEVVQDTYLAVWRAAGSFADGAAVDDALGWLWTVAARRLVDAFRREGRHRSATEAATATAAGAAPAAEDALLEWTLSGDVGAALGALAPELRQVLRAMVLDGLTVRETSDLLGIPEGTVKTRARRARLMLREAMS